MAELPFMPLAVESWDADTSHLTDAQDGLYGRLVRLLWKTPNQRIPNDDAWIAHKLRRSVEQVIEQVRPLVREFFKSDGNWITHKRVTKEWRRAIKTTRQRSVAAKARWNKKKEASERNAEESKPAMIPTPTPTPTPTPIEVREEPPIAPPEGGAMTEASDGRKRSATGTRLAADWLPAPDERAYAESLGLNGDVVGEEFRNYWVGVPGAKGRKCDWPATFRNRCIQLAGTVRQGGSVSRHNGSHGSGIPERGGGITGAAQRVARRRGLDL